jgi:hypothetical protein
MSDITELIEDSGGKLVVSGGEEVAGSKELVGVAIRVKGKAKSGGKKSLQVFLHSPLIDSAHTVDLESLALDVQNAMIGKGMEWDTMGLSQQEDACQFVLDNFTARASGSVSATPPELADLLAAAEELWQNVLLVFALSVLFCIKNQLYLLYSESDI